MHGSYRSYSYFHAGLTFELTLQGSSAPSKAADCCKHKEEELQSYKGEVSSLQSALAAYKEEIALLKRHLLSAESALSQEVGLRDAKINSLGVELEQNAKVVAHLTKKLHHMKLELARISEAMQAPSVADYDDQKTAHNRTILGLIRRRVRRATASALPHSPNGHYQDYTEYGGEMLTRRSLPTPLAHTHTPTPPSSCSVSPRPPSASPPQRLLRRASRVAHRATGHVASDSPPTQAVQSAKCQHSCTNLHLDPVQLQKQAPDITDLLRSRECPTPHVCPVTRPSPPVLPPISSTSDLVAQQTTDPQYHAGHPSSYPIQQTLQSHVILTRSPQLESTLGSVQTLTARTTRNIKEDKRSKKGANSREGKRSKRVLLVKEEMHQRKSQAWQELHQSGSD